MKRLILLLTMALASTACADFNPDLSDLEASGTDGETSDGTSGESSTSGPDMGSSDTGEEDTGSSGMPDMGADEGYCGDGVRNGDEECDGTDFGGETCMSQDEAYVSGELTCTQDCTINTFYCDTASCQAQPDSGDYSACQIDNGNAETCGDPGLYCLALWAPNEEGFCGRTCQQNPDCDNVMFDGCGTFGTGATCAIPGGEAQGRCVIECEIDQECPTGMQCWGTDAFGPFMKICK